MWDFSGLAKSVGVTRSSLFTGKIKRVLHPLTRPIAVAWLKSILQTQQKALLSDVLSLRGGHIPRSPKAWKVLSQGQVVLGSQALEIGLIDALGDVHRVVQEELSGRSIRLYEAWGEQESVPLRQLSGLLL
jgi:ClpP class serine protease